MSGDTAEPKFITQPEDQYIVKNKPAFLTCEVQNATKVLFKCNGKWLGRGTIHSNTVIRNKETETETTRVVFKVTRYDVDTFFSSQNYWCRCVVWNAAGRVKSKKAHVRVAYLSRNFRLSPLGGKHVVGDQVKLSCVPPIGVPVPTVYWMKNELRLRPSSKSNFRATEEGRSLFIKTWGEEDSGNYTCVAKNVASTRKSSTATIHVVVNGDWHEWSSWSACDAICGLGHSERTRSCTNPAPSNGGAWCKGKEKQKKSCTTICPVDGGWTEWSSWSTCSPKCIKRRRRTCTKPAPQNSGRLCQGLDLESNQCAWNQCSKYRKDEIGPSIHTQESVFAGLLLVIIFLFVAFVFFTCKRRRTSSKKQKNSQFFTHTDLPPDFKYHDPSMFASPSKHFHCKYPFTPLTTWTHLDEKASGLFKLILQSIFVNNYPSTSSLNSDEKTGSDSRDGGAKEEVSRCNCTCSSLSLPPVEVAHYERWKTTTL